MNSGGIALALLLNIVPLEDELWKDLCVTMIREDDHAQRNLGSAVTWDRERQHHLCVALRRQDGVRGTLRGEELEGGRSSKSSALLG